MRSTIDLVSRRVPRTEEGVPPPPSPERPPLAPHDPPAPAPQAAAWDRALRVIFMESRQRSAGEDAPKGSVWRANKRGRAVPKGMPPALR
ncbi:MAG TPA: hypothetical protein VME42_10925 [Steroidobacteraceae bacterium]|nr:hypothetical protein [Steroidobacteraceae bacterium]